MSQEACLGVKWKVMRWALSRRKALRLNLDSRMPRRAYSREDDEPGLVGFGECARAIEVGDFDETVVEITTGRER